MKLPALVCVPFVAVAAALTTFHTTREAAQPFTYNHKSFLLNGKPLQLMGGQMDPQRIPREYWRDRLEKAKAMGLNTVFSYIYWNELEPAQGTFDWSGMGGMNDIATWYATVKDVGLHAVLRPGPYVCGEREWGGFPSWLAQVPNSQFQ
jgi:beta-galactosidase GanA